MSELDAEKVVDDIFDYIDLDGSGKITFNEYNLLIKN